MGHGMIGVSVSDPDLIAQGRLRVSGGRSKIVRIIVKD